MSLAKAAKVLGGSLIGADRHFAGVSTDTRTLQPGELFVALKGPNYDGHDFLAQAAHASAAGAMLVNLAETPLPAIQVEDARHALGSLAAFWRQQFDIPVIAITGSNGKTTVKEMTAAIMAETGPGCSTKGNLNNDIGVPLTLLRLRPGDRYAVVELGMNQRGEIHYLSAITRPTVAVITNATEAHLAGLGTVEDVARAKGEIFSALAADGVAVINADDDYTELWRELATPKRCVTFGLHRGADVTADYETETMGSLVHIKTTKGDIDMRLPVLGKHNVANALTATATSLAAGAELQHVKRGLEKLRQISGRLEVKAGVNGSRIIDDTYNANPASLAAGIAVLKDFPGEAVLVLGDMAELGEAAPDIHRRTGELAKSLGISRLFAVGALSKLAVESFGEDGMHFSSRRALVETLLGHLHTDVTVLIKGSRIMRLEYVVQKVTQPNAMDTREVTTR
ncbi:MAG: UDP-N-acetylmuramoyl-tripeptide--D-alanyl-D-alanine ligase [Acidiferrobacterales bacterium]